MDYLRMNATTLADKHHAMAQALATLARIKPDTAVIDAVRAARIWVA